MAECTRVVYCDSNTNSCSSHVFDENNKYMYSQKVDCAKFCNGGCGRVIWNMVSVGSRPNPLIDGLREVGTGPATNQQVTDVAAGRFGAGQPVIDPTLAGKSLDAIVIQFKAEGVNIRTVQVPAGVRRRPHPVWDATMKGLEAALLTKPIIRG